MIKMSDLKKVNLEKLDLNAFNEFSLTGSSLNSLRGGEWAATAAHGGDYIDGDDNTHYHDDGPSSTGDTCKTSTGGGDEQFEDSHM